MDFVEEAHWRWLDLMADFFLLDFRAVEDDREEDEELENAEQKAAVKEENVVLAVPIFDLVEAALEVKIR